MGGVWLRRRLRVRSGVDEKVDKHLWRVRAPPRPIRWGLLEPPPPFFESISVDGGGAGWGYDPYAWGGGGWDYGKGFSQAPSPRPAPGDGDRAWQRAVTSFIVIRINVEVFSYLRHPPKYSFSQPFYRTDVDILVVKKEYFREYKT